MIFTFLLGTAFIAGGDVVTAHHVVKPYVIEYTANQTYDLAYIDTDVLGGYEAKCDRLKQGQKVTIKGYPWILGVQVYTEIETEVLGYGEAYNGRKSIFLNTPLTPGFSGSPVFDEEGNVVAVVTDTLDRESKSLASSVCNLK